MSQPPRSLISAAATKTQGFQLRKLEGAEGIVDLSYVELAHRIRNARLAIGVSGRQDAAIVIGEFRI
jgi:hypothetical protein